MKTFADFGINIPANSTGDVKTHCPRCQETRQKNPADRSLSVNVNLGVWKCHHCDWAGGLSGGGGRTKKVYVRPEYDVPKMTKIPANVITWFAEKRGIPFEILTANHIGANAGGSEILIPYFKNGEVVNVKHRRAGKQMYQEKGAEPCFYNHDGAMACEDKHFLIITEGELDCLAVQTAGFPAVVSVPAGADSATDELFINEEALVESFKQFIIFGDADEKGRQLEMALIRRLGPDRCYRVRHPEGCKDANDVLLNLGVAGVKETLAGASPAPIDGLYSAGDVLGELMELYDAGDNSGLSTGWLGFDKHYTVRPCEMTIVTGIPSHGKSTWLDALMVNLWRRYGFKACYCSPENWPIQRHISNLIENIVGKPFGKCDFANERMTKEEAADALHKIEQYFYFVMLDEQDMAVDTILKRMRASIYRHGVNGIILDPWNEIEQQRPAGMSETEFVSQTLGKIRRFARTNEVHVWIVAHPTKMPKDKETGVYQPPRLYDISGSAHFYNKADNGITVYRVPDAEETQVYVNKVRFKEVGTPGVKEFYFNRKTNRYREKDGEVVERKAGYGQEDDCEAPF